MRIQYPLRILHINNFVPPSNLPENHLDTEWQSIQKGLDMVIGHREVPPNMYELYTKVKDLCFYGYSRDLCLRVFKTCTRLIAQIETSLLVSEDASAFVKEIDALWKEYCRRLELMRNIFLYFDRTYMSHQGVKSIWNLGLDLFRERIFSRSSVYEKIIGSIGDLMGHARRKNGGNREAIRSIVGIFVDLGMCESHLVDSLCSSTHWFYSEIQKTLVLDDVDEYLDTVEQWICTERDLGEACFSLELRTRLEQIVETTLISHSIDTVLDKSMMGLIEKNKMDNLGRLWDLCGRISDGYEILDRHWRSQIRGVGTRMVERNEIEDLFGFRRRMDEVVREMFSGHQMFYSSIRDTFEYLVNIRGIDSAKMLARLVRPGNADLDHMFGMFRLAHEKDVFRTEYQKCLADRILSGPKTDLDTEKKIVDRLRTECGSEFTTVLDKMFDDMEESRAMCREFQESVQDCGMDVHVRVLDKSIWPIDEKKNIIPDCLRKYQDMFSEFYVSKHSGRSLTWTSGVGSCIMVGRFRCGTKTMKVSMDQAVVLSVVDWDGCSVSTILAQSGMDRTNVCRVLKGLIWGKHSVLTKIPDGFDILDTDIVSVDEEFECVDEVLEMDVLDRDGAEESREEEKKESVQDIQQVLDSTIVRIMKSREVMKWVDLLAEIQKMMSVQVSAEKIKERISSLCEREFMRETRKSPLMYRYIP